MVFKKGDKPYKLRKVNAGGRPRKALKAEIDALARDKRKVPYYIEKLSNIALNSPDEKLAFQACTYLIDRHEGKAKQVQDVNVKPVPLAQSDYDDIVQIKLAEQRLLAQFVDQGFAVCDGGNGDKG